MQDREVSLTEVTNTYPPSMHGVLQLEEIACYPQFRLSIPVDGVYDQIVMGKMKFNAHYYVDLFNKARDSQKKKNKNSMHGVYA